MLELIRSRLRPYPAFDGNAAPVASYVVPDSSSAEHDEIPGEFTVDLVEPALTRLSVRPITEGRGARRRPEPRHRTRRCRRRDPSSPSSATGGRRLRRVAECAIERQKDFLVGGAAALKPLTRAEVAAELDLHESTVSRTVADKYALLPDRTIVPLSRFFGASGGVDGELQKLLESADGPLSDQRLAELLREAGYPIARRTVAKHRARLGYTAAAMR